MMNTSNKQLDFFSEEESLWHKQSKQTTSQLHEQLALLLLSCLQENKQVAQTNKEDQPCPVK